MKRHSRIVSSIAVAAIFLGASPAGAQMEQATPVYDTAYYSDASHSEQVGAVFWTGGCDQWGNAYYRQTGTQTAYPVEMLVGYCYSE